MATYISVLLPNVCGSPFTSVARGRFMHSGPVRRVPTGRAPFQAIQWFLIQEFWNFKIRSFLSTQERTILWALLPTHWPLDFFPPRNLCELLDRPRRIATPRNSLIECSDRQRICEQDLWLGIERILRPTTYCGTHF